MVVRYDELLTARLSMRRWREADRAPFADMNADPDVMRHFPALQDRATSDASVDRFERGFEQDGFGIWALERLDDRSFIGFTGLNQMMDGVPGAGELEIGWRLARAAWGRGFATEAATAALDLAFGDLGYAEVWSKTAVTNAASRRLMERLGMSVCATFDHPLIDPDSPVRPHVAYRLTADAWVSPTRSASRRTRHLEPGAP